MSSSETPILSEPTTSTEVAEAIVHNTDTNSEAVLPSVASSYSISTLLTGLDYIFYIWTFFLVAIIAYLSVYKYYQNNQLKKQKKTNTLKSNNNNNTRSVTDTILGYIYLVLKLFFNIFVFIFKSLKNLLLNNNNANSSFVNRNYTNYYLSSQDSLTCLNNCLKWFYFSAETTKRINYNILNLINSGNFKPSPDSKYDDIYFKSVDTLPPKFTNIQTVLSDNDNLTLKCNIEFKNIQIKAEFKRSHRHVDFTVLNASGQALIVLGQSKNSAYVLDCSFDPQSELNIEFKKDPSIENNLTQFVENILKNAIKQFMLNLELNFQNKRLTGSTKINTQHTAPQFNISSAKNSILNSNIGTTSSLQPTNSKLTHEETTKINPEQMSPSQIRNNLNEKRLLVKFIKANNLANCEEPYCVVELDYPMQKHLTDVHKDISSINEQFLFDITPNSEELSIYVYDRAKDYGNDLVGEAVLPVNDLCTGNSGKRVIQLHRFGSQKTGSITVEFMFIEPVNPRIELRNRSSIASRSSRSPYDTSDRQLTPVTDPKNPFNYRDDLLNETKMVKTNLDNSSINSYTGQRQTQNFSHSPNSANKTTNIQILNDPTSTRHHYIQPVTQAQDTLLTAANPSPNSSTSGRVINRNYLQIQPSSIKSNTLQSNQLISSVYSEGAFRDDNPDEPKRTRSISRSVRSLFKPKSSKKRDKSYDVQASSNQYDAQSVDLDNLKKSKSIGGSLKRLFNIKKTSKKYEGSVHETARPGSPNAISITVSRPSDANFSAASHAGHILQPVNADYMNNQATYQTKHANNFGNVQQNVIRQNDESFERKEPLLLKRSFN